MKMEPLEGFTPTPSRSIALLIKSFNGVSAYEVEAPAGLESAHCALRRRCSPSELRSRVVVVPSPVMMRRLYQNCAQSTTLRDVTVVDSSAVQLLSGAFRFAPKPMREARERAKERARLSAVLRQPIHAAALRSIHDQPTVSRALTSAALAMQSGRLLERLEGDEGLEGTWGVNVGDRRALYHLVAGLRCASVLEIGTNVGASTAWLAAALVETTPTPRLVTVDLHDVHAVRHEWPVGTQTPRERVDAVGGTFVEFVTDDSARFWGRSTETFDLIFLDGNHEAPAVYKDVCGASQHLNPGGVIVLHDYFPDLQPLWKDSAPITGPSQAMARCCEEAPSLTVQPLGALLWPTKLGTNRTSLAVVLRS